MAIESRLRRAETAADLWIQRQFAELDRQLLAAGSDCTRVFCIHMARAIVADGPDPRTLASLRDNGAWLPTHSKGTPPRGAGCHATWSVRLATPWKALPPPSLRVGRLMTALPTWQRT